MLCNDCIKDKKQGITRMVNVNLDIDFYNTSGYTNESLWGDCSNCRKGLSKTEFIYYKRHERRKNEIVIDIEEIKHGDYNILGGFDPLLRKYKGNPFTGIGIINYESRKLKTEIYYEDGYQIRFKNFYESGLIKCDTCVKDGQSHGEEKTWYETGELESESNYENDKGEGLFKKYYKTGQVNTIGFMMNNEPIGIWKYFHINGQLNLEIIYRDGVSISVKSWDIEGYEISLKSWKNINEIEVSLDHKTGKQKYISNNEPYSGISFENYPNCNIKCITEYKEGGLLSQTCWDEDGNKIECEEK